MANRSFYARLRGSTGAVILEDGFLVTSSFFAVLALSVHLVVLVDYAVRSYGQAVDGSGGTITIDKPEERSESNAGASRTSVSTGI